MTEEVQDQAPQATVQIVENVHLGTPLRVNSSQIAEIRASWKFAAATHFVSLFAKPLKIFVETKEIESWISATSLAEEMRDMFVSLTRSVTGNRNVTKDLWIVYTF